MPQDPVPKTTKRTKEDLINELNNLRSSVEAHATQTAPATSGTNLKVDVSKVPVKAAGTYIELDYATMFAGNDNTIDEAKVYRVDQELYVIFKCGDFVQFSGTRLGELIWAANLMPSTDQATIEATIEALTNS